MHLFCYRLTGSATSHHELEEIVDIKVLAYNKLVDDHVERIKNIIVGQPGTLIVENDPIKLDEFSLAAAHYKHLNPFEHEKTSEEVCADFARDILNRLLRDPDVLKKLAQDTELQIMMTPPRDGAPEAKGTIELCKRNLLVEIPLDDAPPKKRCEII
jgi:hypothetical protein